MKKFISTLIIVIIQYPIFGAKAATSCSPINSIRVPQHIEMTLKMLGAAFTSVEITDANDPKLKIKPPQLIRKTGEQINLVAGTTIKPGDTIITNQKQIVNLKLFMPTVQEFKLSENSKMSVNSFSDVPGQSLVTIHSGRLESNGEHRKKITDPNEDGFDAENESSDVETSLCQTTPIGTKYSVDLNSAIAEANGEQIETENYAVEKGSIQIKLRRANTFSKLNIKSKRKDFKVSKNGAFKLKAGQKARVRVNKKTKIADVEVIEPE